MKRYIRATNYKMCFSLFKVTSADQPIDREDYDSYSCNLTFNYIKGDCIYELISEAGWKDPEVAAFAEQFDNRWIQIRSWKNELAVELWNKELKARGINKTITVDDLRDAVRRCNF